MQAGEWSSLFELQSLEGSSGKYRALQQRTGGPEVWTRAEWWGDEVDPLTKDSDGGVTSIDESYKNLMPPTSAPPPILVPHPRAARARAAVLRGFSSTCSSRSLGVWSARHAHAHVKNPSPHARTVCAVQFF